MPNRTADQTAAGPRPAPPGLDALLAGAPPPVAALLHRLRDAVLAAHPTLRERVYQGWHGLGFHHPTGGYLAALFPREDDVLVGFQHGADLPDPHDRLLGTRRQVRYLRLQPARPDGDPGPAELELLVDYLDLAVDLAVDMAQDRAAARSRRRARSGGAPG